MRDASYPEPVVADDRCPVVIARLPWRTVAGVTIRRAGLADRSLVLHFHRALYVTHREAIVPPELEELHAYRDIEAALRDDVESLLRTAGSTVLIAERDGVPVGYASGHVEDDPRRVLSRKGVVEDWYVEPDARGEGIGRALLEALLDAFRAAGCQLVESMTWATNEGARAAHRAFGFREVQVRMRRKL